MRKRNPFKVTALAAAVSAGSLLTLPGYAIDISSGDLQIRFDTTATLGVGIRTEDIDYRSVGPINAAAAAGVQTENNPNLAADLAAFQQTGEFHLHNTGSQDNSNLRYDKGDTFSELFSMVFDLEMTYMDYGGFFRARAFYDNAIASGDGGNQLPAYYPTDENGEPAEPIDYLGRGFRMLDAFVWGNWFIQDTMPLNVRFGRQVISWGESVFFPNGINSANPIDVNALLAPGASLKEALIPVTALSASIGINENLSFEAFYQFEWRETELPGCGTYYSTTDLVGRGCWGGFFVGGGESNSPMVISGQGLPADFARLPRGSSVDASDSGQFGMAMRYYFDAIETEVGLYFMNYHSRLPLLSGHTPTTDEILLPTGTTLRLPDVPLSDVRAALIGATGSPFGTAFLLPNSDYFIEYPEDIKLLGVSFNTAIDFGLPGGSTSVAGELSARWDQPFQIEDGVLLAGLVGLPSQICEDSPNPYDCYFKFGSDEYVPGYIKENYYQAELAFIHFLDPMLGASRWTIVLDIAAGFADIPDKEEMLLNSGYNAALVTPWLPDAPWFNPNNLTPRQLATALNQPFEQEMYPNRFAWGYKLQISGEYSNLFAGVNFTPAIAFGHDVNGVSPGPLTNFLEDRMNIGLSGEFVYQNTYSLKVGYNNFFGAAPYNQLADRDSLTISASVSF